MGVPGNGSKDSQTGAGTKVSRHKACIAIRGPKFRSNLATGAPRASAHRLYITQKLIVPFSTSTTKLFHYGQTVEAYNLVPKPTRILFT